MEFRILGPLELVREGRVLQLGSGRQLALVAVLLIHANEAVSVDRLVDELWGESPPPTAAKIVRNSVSSLRRELGDRLVTQPPGYLMRVEEGELDSERLERAVASRDPERLTEALALWRGRPLSQLAYEPFAQAEIARLEELRLAGVEAWADGQLALGRHADVIAELETFVREHPLRERLCGQVMLALYRSGRQADALEAYRQARRSLDEQLGIEPGPELRELERKILNQDESLGAPSRADSAVEARRGRGLKLVVAGAFVLLAAAVAAAFLATRDSGSGGLAAIRPNSVGMIDPGTNRIVAEIPVGIRPGPVAAGARFVWIANLEDRNLTKIDSRRRTAAATISLGNRTPTGVAVGAGAVWVAFGLRGELSRVEPQFGEITKTISITGPPRGAPLGSVAVGAGYVWPVYGDSTLARIRPAAVRLSGSVLVGSSPAGVVVGAGAVWVANSGDATVQRFNPATFQEGPIRTINVGKQPIGIAYGGGALWVTSRGDDVLTRLDPNTNSAITIRVGDAPVAVAMGAGAVWVANSGDGTVSRVDTTANRVVRTIHVGGAPAGITFADGFVWVAVQSP